jgi:hypothetical protein
VRRVLPLLCLLVILGGTTGTAAATTEPSLTVGVNVALTTTHVKLSQASVRRGYYVRFLVRNTTPARRTFSLAGRTIAIPAKKSRYMVVDFLVRGRYLYASRGPRNAIRGLFRVS